MKKLSVSHIAAGINILLAIMLFTVITGCKKDSTDTQKTDEDGSTLNFVLGDNFNFSTAYAAVNNTGTNNILAEKGPYTMFVPNNNAFLLVNIYDISRLSLYTNSQLSALMKYGIVNEKLELKQLPLTDNKVVKTLSGGNAYISKYVTGADTVITINGVKVVSMDNPASNGLIQVIPQLVNPEVYTKVAACLRADTSLTLFNAAMERSGLSADLLNSNDAYTVIAPSNQAFQQSAKLGLNLGVSTLDSITHAQPAKLATLLRYHLLKGRYFDNDLFRLNNSNGAVSMLNGGKVSIGGLQGGFKSITFTATMANAQAAQIMPPSPSNPTTINVNITCGNGVVHIIDRVLIQ